MNYYGIRGNVGMCELTKKNEKILGPNSLLVITKNS